MSENTDHRGRPRVQTVNDGPEVTVQSDTHLVDLNRIMEKYRRTGLVEALDETEAKFMDCTAFQDYADVMRTAKEAEMEFMKLPSKVREIFHHDVAEWLDTAHDEKKREALVAAGAIKRDPEIDTPGDGAPEEDPVEAPAE